MAQIGLGGLNPGLRLRVEFQGQPVQQGQQAQQAI